MRLKSVQGCELCTVRVYEAAIGQNRFKVEKIVDGKIVKSVRKFSWTAADKVAQEWLKEA